MNVNNTPFTTNTFQTIWKNHFKQNKSLYTFQFLNGVNFYKSGVLPLYRNIGKNITKGNIYNIRNNTDYKNKVFLIYDVPANKDKNSKNETEQIERLKILKTFQCPGYLIRLDKFKDIDDYLVATFSKNTRMKMRKFNKRLEKCFDISSKMFFGNIDKNEYDSLFEYFILLLEKRYAEKQISNNNMNPSEWNFYKDVAYPLIIENKASLFVIYDNKVPIAITYNYHTNDTLIDAITVFDNDYLKFNLGYVNNLRLLEWCFDNNVKAFDFSKGEFGYKDRMCTLKYEFEYHIIYDKHSTISKLIAFLYYIFFEFKKYLRDKRINLMFHRFTYKVRNTKFLKQKQNIEITELSSMPKIENLLKIDIKKDANYSALRRTINDFLYLIVLPYDKIQVFKVNNDDNTYFLSSTSLIQQVKIIK